MRLRMRGLKIVNLGSITINLLSLPLGMQALNLGTNKELHSLLQT